MMLLRIVLLTDTAEDRRISLELYRRAYRLRQERERPNLLGKWPKSKKELDLSLAIHHQQFSPDRIGATADDARLQQCCINRPEVED